MDLRLTVTEAATYLGRRKHWIYNSLPKVCNESIYDSKFITAEMVDKLIQFAFMSRTYESYPFEKIAISKAISKALVGCKRLEDLRDVVKTKEQYAELLIALRLTKSKSDMFNLISYTKRKLGAEDWMNGDTLKDYVYEYLCNLVAAGKEEIDILIAPEYVRNEVINAKLVEELNAALLNIIKQDCAIKRKK